MAYQFHVSTPIRTQVGGKQYLCFTITEAEVGPADEWTIGCLPQFFTITLFESAVTAGPAGQTVSPRLGTAPAWSDDSIDDVAENAKPAAAVRMACSVRVTSPVHRLCGRTSPALGGSPTTEVITRVTLIEGH